MITTERVFWKVGDEVRMRGRCYHGDRGEDCFHRLTRVRRVLGNGRLWIENDLGDCRAADPAELQAVWRKAR